MTTIVSTDLPNISQVFSRIDARSTNSTIYAPNANGTNTPHHIVWIAPFSRKDNGWELNVVLHDLKVNVKCIGLDVYVDDVKLSSIEVFDIKAIIAKKFALGA
jgi:hypothetical protein